MQFFDMKRIITFMTILAALAIGQNLSAQKKDEINIHTGFASTEYILAIDAINSGDTDLYSIYEPSYGNLRGFSCLTVSYSHKLLPWLGVGGIIGGTYFSGFAQYKTQHNSTVAFEQVSLQLLPQAKFFIPSPKHFRLYGKAGVGINFTVGTSKISEPVRFAWEVVPIGFEWGGNVVFGTAEFCAGSIMCGARIGIGVRF